VKIVHTTFEQANLGVDAYEIAVEAADTPEGFAVEEQKLIAEGAEYLVIKTPVNRPDWLFALPRMGYTFVETVFHVAIKRSEYHMPPEIARFDRGLTVLERTSEWDRERVYGRIRSGVFKSDRVSIDPPLRLRSPPTAT